VTKAKPDGYTLGSLSCNAITERPNIKKTPYDPVNGFSYICEVFDYGHGFVVRADAPWKTFSEFVEAAKKEPGKMTVSMSSIGGTMHVALAKLEQRIPGFKLAPVPFKGGAAAVTALLGGHVNACFQTKEWKPYVDSGQLRLLAVTTKERMKDYPNNYFACSRNAGKWLFGKRVSNLNELVVLNNAVNVDEFKYDVEIRKKVRKELGIGNELVIGHIGRFNKQKNHNFLIDIFKAVSEVNPDAILLLAGDGDLRRKIEKKVSRLGLKSKVKFLGVRNDINSIMQAMDLFLLPSLFEGLPVVLIEAQAAGLKCIVADTITRESDITSRVEFLRLNDTPEKWANQVLSSTYEHADTEKLISMNGYNTVTMSKWLADFYFEYYQDAK